MIAAAVRKLSVRESPYSMFLPQPKPVGQRKNLHAIGDFPSNKLKTRLNTSINIVKMSNASGLKSRPRMREKVKKAIAA